MPYLSDFFEDDPEAFRKRQEAYPSEGLASIIPEIADFVKTAKYYPNESHPANEPTAEEMAVNLGFAPQEALLDKTQAPPDLSAANISNMGKKQQLDYNAARGGQPAPVAVPTLADVYDAQREKEGWKTVPGTQSFMQPGAKGAYRVESGITPEGQRATAAADSLRAYNKGKYGGSGNFGGAGAEVLNPAENIAALGRQAYATGAPRRQRLAAEVGALEQELERMAMVPGGVQHPAYKQMEEQYAALKDMLNSVQGSADKALMGSAGVGAELLKPLEAIQEKEQQRQEYGMLANLLNGGRGNAGPMNKATYDAYGKAISGQREERRLDNADRSFNRLTGNDQYRQNNPHVAAPSAAMVKMQMQSLLPPGTQIARIAGQDILVKAGTSTPVPNGDVIVKQAYQQAQQQLMQRPATNPKVVQHPAVQAIKQMLDAEAGGTLPPHQGILLQRFKTNYNTIKQELMKNGADEMSAKEQAMILAAGDVAGVR